MHRFLRRAGLALAAVAVTVAAASCGGSSSSSSSSATTSSGGAASHMGGTLKLQATGSPDYIDPALAYTVEAWQSLITTDDGLLAFHITDGPQSTQLVPDLATAIPKPTDGGLTYVFNVRPGIKYSNGDTVKPSDFTFAFERSFKVNGAGTFYWTNLVGYQACITKPKTCDLSKGIVADDAAGTVTFKLTHPDGDFLFKLAMPFAYALPPSTPIKPATTQSLPGTGPYMITSYKAENSLTLERNPHFKVWAPEAQPQGYPDTIQWQLGLDGEAMTTNIENNTADWMYEVPPPDRLNQIATQYASQFHVHSGPSTYWMDLNTHVAPFNNPNVRKAVNFAMDRNAIIKAYGGPKLAAATCQVLPPGFNGYEQYCPYTANPAADGKGPWTGPDLAKAQQLIDASGTKGMKVTVWTNTSDQSKAVGLYFVSLLNQLGYKTGIKSLDRSVYFDTIENSKNKTQIMWDDWYPDYPAASNFINQLLSCDSFIPNSTSNSNDAEYCNKDVDKLITKALNQQLTDVSAANVTWAQADHKITDDAPWASMFNASWVDFLSKRVQNYKYSIQWFILLDQLQVQ
jgi:peptide/nickel transport system substrate-binding protein